MIGKLRIVNSLTKEKEVFEPLAAPACRNMFVDPQYIVMCIWGMCAHSSHLMSSTGISSFSVIKSGMSETSLT